MSLPAGRELDAVVAEAVMGWTITNRRDSWGNRIVEGPFDGCDCGSHCVADTIPEYSTSIGAAWEVVGKLDLLGSRGPLGGLALLKSGDLWELQDEAHITYTQAETAPLAICRAALKAVAP
jgi:hypothetical protein